WLHELRAAYGLPSAVVAWTDLLAPDADERLAEQVAYPLVRGVRFKPAGEGEALRDERWLHSLALLRRHGLSWDLRVPFHQLEEAAALLREAPDVRVVLEHAGLPWDRSDAGLAA